MRKIYTYMYMEICKCIKSHANIPVSFTIYAFTIYAYIYLKIF